MDIVVKGRRAEVSDRFRHHVESKLAKLERLDHKAFRIDVELSREPNPRMSGIRERVELTVFSRGPVIRAEAAAPDAYAALDLATAKITERLRRAADRRARHHTPAASGGRAGGVAVADLLPAIALPDLGLDAMGPDIDGRPGNAEGDYASWAYPDDNDASPMLVREKTHAAPPMTLDDALSNMELVGHDFYLYRDSGTGLPAVVYRRRGYDYGVIRLQTVEASDVSGPSDDPGEVLGATVTR